VPPAAEDVAAFLGRPGDAAVVGPVEQYLPIVESLVRRHVRGNGFVADHPDDDGRVLALYR